MLNKQKFFILATAMALFGAGIVGSPAYASDGSTDVYLSDPIFRNLMEALSTTQSLIMNQNVAYQIVDDSITYPKSTDMIKQHSTTTYKIYKDDFSAYTTYRLWNLTTNDWEPNYYSDFARGYDDQLGRSYQELDLGYDSTAVEALARLKKSEANWATAYDWESPFAPAISPDLYPKQVRKTLLAQLPLASLSEISGNLTGFITNIASTNNGDGTVTVSLRSDSDERWSDNYTFLIGGESTPLVQSVRLERYLIDESKNQTQEILQEDYTLSSLAGTVDALMPSDAASVDLVTFNNMYMRINAENQVKPLAATVLAKAKAKKAKGKLKNVVTAKMIQAIAKAAKITATKTKTGIRISGVDPEGYVKGFICVSAVKKRVTSSHC